MTCRWQLFVTKIWPVGAHLLHEHIRSLSLHCCVFNDSMLDMTVNSEKRLMCIKTKKMTGCRLLSMIISKSSYLSLESSKMFVNCSSHWRHDFVNCGFHWP